MNMVENKLETINNLFEGNEIRIIWDSEKEESWLTTMGSQLYDIFVQLKMKVNNWKYSFNIITKKKGGRKIK